MSFNNNQYNATSNGDYTQNRHHANAVNSGRRLRHSLQRFLWWVAGKSSSLMAVCAESVRIKYSAIGIWLILIVPTFGAFAMAALLSDLNFGFLARSAGGVFYASVLVALERIMMSFPNSSDKRKNWLRAIPRFVIIICASYLITETLITVAFDRQIREEMAREADNVVMQRGANLRQEDAMRVNQLTVENAGLKTRLDELFKIRVDAETAMQNEADGQGGTFTKGEGDNYKRRRDAFDRASAEYESEKPVIEERLRVNVDELTSLNTRVTKAESEKRSIEDQADDLLARHEALMRIIASRPLAALLYGACWIFLMMIDVIAFLQKLIADPDEYDDRFHLEVERRNLFIREEQKRALRMVRETNVVQTALESRILTSVRDGQPEKLPEMEQAVGKRVHGDLIRTASNELTSQVPSNEAPPEFSDAIKLEVIGSDLQGVLRLPRLDMERVTIPQLQAEFEQIGKAMSARNGNAYQLERAENSLGLEIWPDAPLVAQLEPDRLARLKFRISPPRCGWASERVF